MNIIAILLVFIKMEIMVAEWKWQNSIQKSWTNVALFQCAAYERWDSSKSDNEQAKLNFVKWLTIHQKRCHLLHFDILHNYGIGSSIIIGSLHFLSAIRQRHVYRPHKDVWLWADAAPKCTLAIPSLDCYFTSVSECLASAIAITPTISEEHSLADSNLSPLSSLNSSSDPCALGRHFKKPLIWVFGQIVDYIIRMPPPLAIFVHNQLSLVYGTAATLSPLQSSFSTSLAADYSHSATAAAAVTPCCSVGIHVRGGDPDADRKPIPFSYYMHALDAQAALLEQSTGSSVHTVYVCSDDIKGVIGSAADLTAKYPRRWKYVVTPHTEVGDHGKEQELELRRIDKSRGTINRRALVFEYIADIEILARATLFIGCHSNVYAMVAAIRMSRFAHVHPLNRTCLLDHRIAGFPVHCESSVVSMAFWSSEFIDLGFAAHADNVTYWKE